MSLNGAALAFDASGPADDSPATSAAADKPTSGKPSNAQRSARSIECSQKADAQSLHGKPRKRFMRDCKHAD